MTAPGRVLCARCMKNEEARRADGYEFPPPRPVDKADRMAPAHGNRQPETVQFSIAANVRFVPATNMTTSVQSR